MLRIMRFFSILAVAICFVDVHIAFAEAVCFKCHNRTSFNKKITHKPLAQGKCGACHNPHVARYEGLLQRQGADLCFSCHRKESKTYFQGMVHAPVRRGECLACHDPHASQAKGLLKGRRLADNCFACHKELPKKYKVTHSPYAKGRCSACHQPHQANNHLLLKAKPDAVCFSCHRKKTLQQGHKNFPGRVKGCLSCHNPHGSNRKALVRNVLHKPFAKGCTECHGKGKGGTRTCLACHDKVKEEMFTSHSHLGAKTGNSCVACHSPHAGDGAGLFQGGEAQICRSCHKDSYTKSVAAAHPHPDVEQCSACHAPHGSNHLAMMRGDGNATCSRCHESQGEFTHPVGEKVRDPRTGQQVTCVSCHNPMGTDFKFNLKLSGTKDLCVQCHRAY